MSKDPYSVLGLKPDASEAEVRRTFRELARRYHPDSELGDADKMAEVNDAYEAIINRSRTTEEQQPAVDPRAQAADTGDEQGAEDHSYSATVARAFSGFGCFADNYEAVNGGPPDRSTKLTKAWREICDMDLDDAVETLESIGESNRNGRWYYYYSMADALLGEQKEAIAFATKASQESPNSVEIQDYYQKIVKLTKDWLASHPEENPDVLFTKKRTIRFIIGFAIFLLLAFIIYAKTGVLQIPGIS
ncbi:MAG: J domain-containing protein [Coriobacteriales bacterium]